MKIFRANAKLRIVRSRQVHFMSSDFSSFSERLSFPITCLLLAARQLVLNIHIKPVNSLYIYECGHTSLILRIFEHSWRVNNASFGQ